MHEPRVVIIGAGPAGLTAAYELAKHGVRSTILEADRQVGGIARTVVHKGFRFDIGGHRFFSKSAEIEQLWTEIAGDVLLTRPRLSRIHYRDRFFHYPLRPLECLRGLGVTEAARCVASYLLAQVGPRREDKNLEEWITSRFGRRLYEIFFKTYTEKVWGMPCSEIGADWAAQRIQDLSLAKAIKNACFGPGKGEVMKTLIDEFRYPRLGPGQLWERCAEKVEHAGARILFERAVTGLRMEGGRVRAVLATGPDGAAEEHECDQLVSSMPLRELVLGMTPSAPAPVRHAAARLRYRDFLTVGLVVDRAELFPDNWIYVHTPGVKVGRIQNYKQWSPEMVPDASRTCIGLEYFVWQDDDLWRSPDERLVEVAIRDASRLGLLMPREVSDGLVIRQEKAYPIYDDGYRDRLAILRRFVGQIPNLQTVGRNGQHRYNNQDHSMATALLAARAIATGVAHDAWEVNVDGEYHEGAGTGRSAPIYRDPGPAAAVAAADRT